MKRINSNFGEDQILVNEGKISFRSPPKGAGVCNDKKTEFNNYNRP